MGTSYEKAFLQSRVEATLIPHHNIFPSPRRQRVSATIEYSESQIQSLSPEERRIVEESRSPKSSPVNTKLAPAIIAAQQIEESKRILAAEREARSSPVTPAEWNGSPKMMALAHPNNRFDANKQEDCACHACSLQ